MSELQSVPITHDSSRAVLKEWEFDEGDAISGIWGIAKTLEEKLVEQDDPDETLQCLSIALVNLVTQLKESM